MTRELELETAKEMDGLLERSHRFSSAKPMASLRISPPRSELSAEDAPRFLVYPQIYCKSCKLHLVYLPDHAGLVHPEGPCHLAGQRFKVPAIHLELEEGTLDPI